MSEQYEKKSNPVIRMIYYIIIGLAIFIIFCICFNFKLFTSYFGNLKQMSFFEFFRRLFFFLRDCILFMR